MLDNPDNVAHIGQPSFRSELIEVVTSAYRLYGSRDQMTVEDKMNYLFTKIDTDFSGEITKEEFALGARKHPDILTCLMP